MFGRGWVGEDLKRWYEVEGVRSDRECYGRLCDAESFGRCARLQAKPGLSKKLLS